LQGVGKAEVRRRGIDRVAIQDQERVDRPGGDLLGERRERVVGGLEPGRDRVGDRDRAAEGPELLVER
jgi:hypothetical protein